MRRLFFTTGLGIALVSAGLTLSAHAPSGAIFTTVADGGEVNFNHFPSKEAVYLDGGPGVGAPQHAAALDDGPYVFQVTDPAGRTLLSTDIAECRQFTVAGGVIVSTAPSSCGHLTGIDQDHAASGAITVQLMPYDNTPNNGGVYKVWVTPREDYLAGCAALGVPDGLAVVNCGTNAANKHGFVPAHSKTDNFKVKDIPIREIDTRFYRDADNDGHLSEGETFMDGYGITWLDTHGASNNKYSYWAPEIMVFHEAHVEVIEDGIHRIVVSDQPGCAVGTIHVGENQDHYDGPSVIPVEITKRMNNTTIFVDVACKPLP
jgi:hypothetical protein